MKKFACLITLFFALWSLQTNCFGQNARDKKKIEAIFDKIDKAWNAHDFTYLSSSEILDENSVLINPVGTYWKNRDEIAKGIGYLSEVRFKYMNIVERTILTLRFFSPSVALVVCSVTDEVQQDFTMPGETTVTKKGERMKAIQSFTFVKQNDSWKISSLQITEAFAGK
jgi:uncharacterized protein (TIGR02246 family)